MKALKQELVDMKASKEEVEDEMNKLRGRYEEQLAVVDGSSQPSKLMSEHFVIGHVYRVAQKIGTIFVRPNFTTKWCQFFGSPCRGGCRGRRRSYIDGEVVLFAEL